MTPPLTSKFLQHDGVSTHYLESIPASGGSGQTLVLVHDGWFGADAATLYSRVIRELAEFRVLAPDMLGFGQTDKIVYFDRSMYQYRAAHLGSFVRAVCAPEEQVHAVGTSMGGSILLRDAVSAEPRIPARGVVSISGSGGPWRSSFGAGELANYTGTVEDLSRVMAHMADPFDDHDAVLAARQANTERPGHVECLLAGGVKHPSRPSKTSQDRWPEPLREVSVPVTVIAGRHDPLLETGWEANLEGISPLLSTRVLDARHAPSLDHPEQVAALLREHLRRAAELGAAHPSRGR